MVQRARWFLIGLILVSLGLFFLRPEVIWQSSRFLHGFENNSNNLNETKKLLDENLALRAEIAKLSVLPKESAEQKTEYILGDVFSRYPFNFKNELLVDVGKNAGVELNAPTMFDKILIGKVTKVFGNYSLIQTLFDPGWQSAVRIGKSGVQGLLTGGIEPRVVLIKKSDKLMTGDIVYNVAPGLPYGAPIAAIKKISIAKDQSFLEAELDFTYPINNLISVWIIKNNEVPATSL